MARKFKMDRTIKDFQRSKNKLPVLVANIAVNHFKRPFVDGGFTDGSLKPWAPRLRKTKADKRTGLRRGILVQSSNLLESIRRKVARFSFIQVEATGIEYSILHNRGVGRLPKRQFMGRSKVMNKRIKLLIRKNVKAFLKQR